MTACKQRWTAAVGLLTTVSIFFRLLLVTIAILGIVIGDTARAGVVEVEGGGKSKDVNFKVYATFLTFRFGDPLVDEDLPAGDKKKFEVNVPFLTDISTVQRIILPNGNTRTATNSYGAITPDPANPGQYTMPLLSDFLAATPGSFIWANLPDMANDDFDVFTFVDMQQFIAGGGVQPPLGTVFSITNGSSPSLPGVYVGLSEIHLDPNVGLVNSNPFTGDVYALGVVNVRAVPEPASLYLLGLGAVVASILGASRNTQVLRATRSES